MNVHAATIQGQPWAELLVNLVVSKELDHLRKKLMYFGIKSAPNRSHETFVEEKKDVEKGDLDKLVIKNKDKLTPLSFLGLV